MVSDTGSGVRRGTLTGQRIGNVQIIRKIGQGGVGAVFLAQHVVLGTSYAVKILSPMVSTDQTTVERFRREAIACGRLNHPNVIYVSDFGFKEGVGIYIIMEHVEGDPLSVVMQRQGKMPVTQAGQIALQICDALEAAHRLGIVHRDLKPGNIIISAVVGNEHHVKVLDFGIARLKDQSNLTAAGLTVGSPHYMSPEQIQGFSHLIGPPSDIYALGVLLYQMLAGTWPIYDDDLMTLCQKQLTLVPAPMGAHRPELSGSKLESLLARLLAKRIQDRPSSMMAITEALKGALEDLIEAEPVEEQGGRTELFNPSRFRILGIVQAIRQRAAGSPIMARIEQTPALLDQPEEVFRALVWGLVCVELTGTAEGRIRSRLAAQCAAALVESALGQPGGERDEGFLKAVEAFARGLDAPRQRGLMEALEPLSGHPGFPPELLPERARAQASGSWRARPTPMPAASTPAPSAQEPPAAQEPSPAQEPPRRELLRDYTADRTRPLSISAAAAMLSRDRDPKRR